MRLPRVRIFTSDACSSCTRAKRLLADKGVEFEEVYFPRHDTDARRALQTLTGRYTVPQVIVDDTVIGGWDDLYALERAGRLDAVLGVA
jgi:glutaredoxin 3